MDNIKVKLVKSRDQDGNIVDYQTNPDGTVITVNAFEAYAENASGELVIRDDVDFTKEDEFAAQKSVWAEVRRTQGNYASSDKTRIEAGMMGRFLMYYRKYLLPAVMNRFGRLQDSHEAGQMTMGIYRGLAQALAFYGPKKLLLSIFGKDQDVTEFYRHKSVQAGREVLIAASLYVIGSMLAGLVKELGDQDDEDKGVGTILAFNMLAIFSKVEKESRSLIPVPFIGGIDDYLTNLGSFTNANRDFLKVSKLITHGLALGAAQFTDESSASNKFAYYQKDTGLFEEGEAKIKKDIMDLSGYMNVYEIFNPETRVDDAWKRR